MSVPDPSIAAPGSPRSGQPFNICIVAQRGRLEYDALLFMKTFRRFNSNNGIEVYICTPVDSPLWESNPDIRGGTVAAALEDLGAHVVPFRSERFGSKYPISNKLFALAALPAGAPFVFFDTDHVIRGDLGEVRLDFNRPTGSVEVPRWPRPQPDGFSRAQIWQAVYDLFDLSTSGWFRPGKGTERPRRFPYFNGGCFYYRCPAVFLNLYRHVLYRIVDSRIPELEGQRLFPWADQIALPVVYRFLNGDPGEYDEDFCFTGHALHYFSKPRLFMPNFKPFLDIVREAVQDPAHKKLFEGSASIDYYLLRDGGDVIEDILRERPGIKLVELRKTLAKRGQWVK